MAAEARVRTRIVALREMGPIWALICALWAASGILWHFFLMPLATPDESLNIPWWVIAIGFGVAESFVVNLHFRSESGSFSFLEIPLVFGLLFVQPEMLWVAIIAGIVPSLLLVRRQPPIKVAFNAANLSLHVAVAAVLFSKFLGDTDPLSPRGWIALFCATILSSFVEIVGINLAIGITERNVDVRRASNMLAFGWLVAMANTLQALIAVLIVVVEPWGAVLLTGSTSVLFVAYRAYVSERDHRERTEFLYHSTRTLRESSETNSAVSVLLAEATSMFRAGTAELVLFAPPDAEEATTAFSIRDGVMTDRLVSDSDAAAIDELAMLAERPLLALDDSTPSVVRNYLDGVQINDAMIGALRSDERPIGMLIVGNRLGSVTTFNSEDLRLFENLVEQSAVALENDQLEQALSRLRELESELSHQARYDLLTGLPNRNLFNSRLDEQLTTAPDAPMFLLYIDLDDFKLVNDRLGHAAGDALLAEVAERINHVIRPVDVAARLGGDEFAVMLTSSQDPEAVAHRIIGTLSAPFLLGADEVRIGASVGIASHEGAASSADLVHRADLAMYAAKDRGKGSVVWYTPVLQKDQSRQQALQTELRRAISEEEFDVVYQPIVDLSDLTIVGAEALVRWNKDGKTLTPAAFIAEAEQSGLIMSIDRLVRRSVLADISTFNAVAERAFFTSLNISARHLQDPRFVDEIALDVGSSDAASDSLVLEVTESAFVGDMNTASRVLEEIRSLGIRIALDDFGTGYSSLSYLRDLPIDFLKIAQPFIEDLRQPNGTPFVDAIISLGRTLSLTVIAEGIEEREELEMLQGLSCELGQGFHFARPMSSTSLIDLLQHPTIAPTISSAVVSDQ